jgi:hypothetical protein
VYVAYVEGMVNNLMREVRPKDPAREAMTNGYGSSKQNMREKGSEDASPSY